MQRSECPFQSELAGFFFLSIWQNCQLNQKAVFNVQAIKWHNSWPLHIHFNLPWFTSLHRSFPTFDTVVLWYCPLLTKCIRNLCTPLIKGGDTPLISIKDLTRQSVMRKTNPKDLIILDRERVSMQKFWKFPQSSGHRGHTKHGYMFLDNCFDIVGGPD